MIKSGCVSAADKYKSLNRYIKTALFLAVSFVCIFSSLFITGVRIGYRVNYNGKNIATVSDKAVFDNAVKLVCKKVEGKNVKAHIKSPQYSLAVSLVSNLSSNTDKMADKIISSTDEIVSGVKIKLDGKTYVYKSEDKRDIVEDYLCKFNVDAVSCKSTFLNDVKSYNGLFLLSDVSNGSINSLLSCVPVKTVANIVTEKETAYKTVTKLSSEMVVGTTMVQAEGTKGIEKISEQVTYLNGNETERITLSSDVLKTPTDRVVVVGTAETPQMAAEKAAAHNSGFIFPLPSSCCKLGDAYGGKRNHKGYDLLAPYGTPVYAVKEGTVIRSSWYKGYGYCVEIDHGNGMVTRYGHASSLIARVGQKVTAGTLIARVGQTGDAYGNHVHFEVIINGKRVNPAPYLNID